MNTYSQSSQRLRVFLCHSSGDKPSVRNLCHRLSAEGVEPWLDEEQLVGGADWELEIRKAVRTSHVVVVCLSKGSITKAGFVQKEIRYALDVADEQPEGTIFIIPLKLEPCNVPERLSHLHWINFYEVDGYKHLMMALERRAESLGISITSPSMKPTDPVELNAHIENIVKLISEGRAVSFLGTGIKPFSDPVGDVLEGEQRSPKTTNLYQFFATLPAVMRNKGYPYPYQFIVTTNSNDVLERAFQAALEPFDLVSYMALPEDPLWRGKFCHTPPDGKVNVIIDPISYDKLPVNEYMKLERNVILKIFGAPQRNDLKQNAEITAEDHYIYDFAPTDIIKAIPKILEAQLYMNRFVFLGYNLRDRHAREILDYIWNKRKIRYKSWAIQLNPERRDIVYWERHSVDLLNVPLEDFFVALNERIRVLPNIR